MRKFCLLSIALMLTSGLSYAGELKDKRSVVTTNSAATFTITQTEDYYLSMVALHFEEAATGTTTVQIIENNETNVVYSNAFTSLQDVQLGFEDQKWYSGVGSSIVVTPGATNICRTTIWRKE